MTILLTTLSLLLAATGLAALSSATMGTGILCFGCIAAILARINQSRCQHKDTMEALGARKEPAAKPEGPVPGLGRFAGRG